jgi:hypothetical protein
MIQENKNQAKSDTKDVISSLPGEKVFGKDIPDIPIEFAEDSSPKPKPSLFEEVISTAIEVLETPLPDGNPLEGPLKITAQTLRTGLIAGHAANATAADVYVISNQKELGSQLEQNEQNRKIAFENLKVIVEEQNRRKSPSTAETKPNADSVRTFTHSEVELQPIELTIDPKWIIPSVPKTP